MLFEQDRRRRASARRRRHSAGTPSARQLTVRALSSMTNEVCCEEFSLPVNFRVMFWPM
jgi:hypothetical protein